MTIEPYRKKRRMEESQLPSFQSGFFPKHLPIPIENLIFSYMNISTAKNLSVLNRYFNKIIPTFFVHSPSSLQIFINFVQVQKPKKHISSFPNNWQSAFHNALPHIKTLIVDPDRFGNQELATYISKATNLESMRLAACNHDVLKATAALPKLTEICFNIYPLKKNPSSSLIHIWNCLSLKKLTIAAYDLTNFTPPNNNQPLLPNLTYLNIYTHCTESSVINQLLDRLTSLQELIVKESIELDNQSLQKLTNLKSLTLPSSQNNITLSNLHSLEFLSTEVDGYTLYGPDERVSALNAFALMIKNLPNLKRFELEYSAQLINYYYSDLDTLNNVHITFDMYYFSCTNFVEFDKLASVKSFSLKIDFDFKSFTSPIFDFGKDYKPIDYRKTLHQLCTIPGLKEIHLTVNNLTPNSEEEEIFIFFLNQLSHKISSIQDRQRDPFLWTDKVIKQLQIKKLINCTRVESSFLKPEMHPFSNDEIFQLFPKLTWESLIRKNINQYAFKIKEIKN